MDAVAAPAGGAFRAFAEYADRYPNLRITRTDDGVVTVAMHTDGGAPKFGGGFYEQLAAAWFDVSADRANAVAIFTSLGDEFLASVDPAALADPRYDLTTVPGGDALFWLTRKFYQNLLDVEVPVIVAVNGPAVVHPEFVLFGDVILAADTAAFKPGWTPAAGYPVGGGALLWLHALGPARGRHVLWSGDTLTADEARALGVVREVVPRAQLLDRAHALAREFLRMPAYVRRYTRLALATPMKQQVLAEAPLGMTLIDLAAIAGAEGRDAR